MNLQQVRGTAKQAEHSPTNLHADFKCRAVMERTTSNILNKERLLKAVQLLSLAYLLKPTTVYILAHDWHKLTVVSKVRWNEQSSTVALYRYSFLNTELVTPDNNNNNNNNN